MRPLLERLRSRKTKWLCRLLLKTLLPAAMPADRCVKAHVHAILFAAMKVRNTFGAAIGALEECKAWNMSVREDPNRSEKIQRLLPPMVFLLAPRISTRGRGVKKTIKKFIHERKIVLEQKVDSYSAQIHFKRHGDQDEIRIFG